MFQLIMEECPLTFGPIATPVCLGCHKTLPPKKVFENIKNHLCLPPHHDDGINILVIEQPRVVITLIIPTIINRPMSTAS